jgi:hypothetical protein
MADRQGGDRLADWACSGVMALTGHAEGPPLVPPGVAATLARQIAERLAAATASSRHPVRLDGAGLLAERAALCGYQRQGQVSAGGATRLLATCDGWAAVSCVRPDDRPLLGALIGAELPTDPWPGVAAWLRMHTAAELADRAAMLGLAAAPVARSTASVDGAAGLRTGAAGELRPPQDLLVVDFSALWAGPLCAHLLGLAGARIVKVETPQRPDGARRGNQAFYDLLHGGHRSVMLDPASAGGRRTIAALVAAADIVIEASRPRALAGFGLDAEEAADNGTVWVSITAAGRDSPRVGFGDDVAVSAGLVARDYKGQPVFCGDALADPLTGLVAAELAMSALGTGRGVLLDIAMSAVVTATLAPRHGDYAPGGATPAEPHHSPAARSAGDDWVVDTGFGPVPVARPRARTPSGRAAAPGEHTDEVLRQLRILSS